MTAKSNSLSKADIREILRHLESSLVVMDSRSAPMTVAEVSLKSMMLTLRRELETQLRLPGRPEQ